jgi:hypothetical protein
VQLPRLEGEHHDVMQLCGFLAQQARCERGRHMKPGEYYGPCHFALCEGMAWDERAPAHPRVVPAGNCFDTAYETASRSGGALRYVEGFHDFSYWSDPHAWLLDEQDRVVDALLPPDVDGVNYLGVCFDLDTVTRIRRSHGAGQSVVPHWLRERSYRVLGPDE